MSLRLNLPRHQFVGRDKKIRRSIGCRAVTEQIPRDAVCQRCFADSRLAGEQPALWQAAAANGTCRARQRIFLTEQLISLAGMRLPFDAIRFVGHFGNLQCASHASRSVTIRQISAATLSTLRDPSTTAQRSGSLRAISRKAARNWR